MNKVSWILAHPASIGPMIVNRNDRAENDFGAYGVGAELLDCGSYCPDTLALLKRCLEARRKHYGDGVLAIDVGANIGPFTIPLAEFMQGWGEIHAYEAQERIFYALCGNILLNNLDNVYAYNALVADHSGWDCVNVPDYTVQASFGSVSFCYKNYDVGADLPDISRVRKVVLSRDFTSRIDLIKIDVEGMEFSVLEGGDFQIRRAKPIIFLEHRKSNSLSLQSWLEDRGYCVREPFYGGDFLAVHKDDLCLDDVGFGC